MSKKYSLIIALLFAHMVFFTSCIKISIIKTEDIGKINNSTQTDVPTEKTYTPTSVPESTATDEPTATMTPSPSVTPTVTLTPTESPKTPQVPISGITIENSICREGPYKNYDVVRYYEQNQVVLIEGRVLDSTWFWISVEDISKKCWMNAGLLLISQDTSIVPVLTPIPSPRPTAKPTQTPTRKPPPPPTPTNTGYPPPSTSPSVVTPTETTTPGTSTDTPLPDTPTNEPPTDTPIPTS